MNYFLIDYENIRSDGLKELTGIQDGDMLVIFYSDQCKNITLDVVGDVLSKQVTFQSFKVSVGTKNALDFQLSSYLGYLIGKNASSRVKYYIVSNDKGYDCLCNYWSTLSIDVTRLATQANAAPAAKKAKAARGTTTAAKKAKATNAATEAATEKAKAASDDAATEEAKTASTTRAAKKAKAARGTTTAAKKAKAANAATEAATEKAKVASDDDATEKAQSASTTARAPRKKASKVKDADLATLDDMTEILTSDEQPSEVLQIFNKYKTKVAINNGLAKKFKDSKKASVIYKKLKPLLKSKNKS